MLRETEGQFLLQLNYLIQAIKFELQAVDIDVAQNVSTFGAMVGLVEKKVLHLGRKS